MADLENLENEEMEEIDTVVFEYEDGTEEEFRLKCLAFFQGVGIMKA